MRLRDSVQPNLIISQSPITLILARLLVKDGIGGGDNFSHRLLSRRVTNPDFVETGGENLNRFGPAGGLVDAVPVIFDILSGNIDIAFRMDAFSDPGLETLVGHQGALAGQPQPDLAELGLVEGGGEEAHPLPGFLGVFGGSIGGVEMGGHGRGRLIATHAG